MNQVGRRAKSCVKQFRCPTNVNSPGRSASSLITQHLGLAPATTGKGKCVHKTQDAQISGAGGLSVWTPVSELGFFYLRERPRSAENERHKGFWLAWPWFIPPNLSRRRLNKARLTWEKVSAGF